MQGEMEVLLMTIPPIGMRWWPCRRCRQTDDMRHGTTTLSASHCSQGEMEELMMMTAPMTTDVNAGNDDPPTAVNTNMRQGQMPTLMTDRWWGAQLPTLWMTTAAMTVTTASDAQAAFDPNNRDQTTNDQQDNGRKQLPLPLFSCTNGANEPLSPGLF